MKRNLDGTFAKGNSGGPGRPKRSTEEKYLKKLISRVTLKEWQKIVDTAIARAQSGDNVARQWLSDYLLGKPKQKIEQSGDLTVRLDWEYEHEWGHAAPKAEDQSS